MPSFSSRKERRRGGRAKSTAWISSDVWRPALRTTTFSPSESHSRTDPGPTKVVHFEIPFDDKKRAMKFYTDCFGWQLTEMPEMSYVMAVSAPVGENQMPREPGAIN